MDEKQVKRLEAKLDRLIALCEQQNQHLKILSSAMTQTKTPEAREKTGQHLLAQGLDGYG